MRSNEPVRKLKGKVLAVEKTGEIIRIDDENWEKCVFTLELTRLSGNIAREQIPVSLKGRRVKIIRYCLYDWHYMLGVEKTIEAEETKAIFSQFP